MRIVCHIKRLFELFYQKLVMSNYAVEYYEVGEKFTYVNFEDSDGFGYVNMSKLKTIDLKLYLMNWMVL